MADTAGDYLCERLIEWEVDTIYGFPGDGINGILGALRRHQDRLRFIQTQAAAPDPHHAFRGRLLARPGPVDRFPRSAATEQHR